MAIFQRNAIISGYVNSYCLVCECFFETEDQTFNHIKSGEHEKELLAHPCLEKYGNNGIRKVKAGYFCEYCSSLMATAAKVNLHIAEKLHYYNKGNALLKQSGSVLTAFDDILLSESAWHSFSDDACAICNAEFDDEDEHKLERAHVVKLLQNKVEFGENNSIYRRIDKNFFQCLTCNCVPAISELDEHFNDVTHKQKYIQCQEEKKKFDLVNPKPKVNQKTEKQETRSEKVTVGQDSALNNKEKIPGNAVDGNKATKEADAEQSNKGIENETKLEATKQAITTSDKAIETKTETSKAHQSKVTNTKTKPKVADTKKVELKNVVKEESNDPMTYAADNKLTYEPRFNKAFCRACEKKFPSTLHGMKEHVQGRDHINKIAKSTAKPVPKKVKLSKKPMEEFVKKVDIFDNTTDNDTVINETVCIPEKSCHLFTKLKRSEEFKCQICMINLFEDDLEEHCRTAKHERGMRQTEVVLDLKDEFIREVRSDSFHCGFCNLVIGNWEAIEEHVKTAEHKNSTASCNRRLQIHLPAIRARKNDDTVRAAFLEFVSHFNRF